LHRSGAGQHQEARAAERRNCRPWETKRKWLPWARPNRPRIPIGGKTGPPRPPSGPALPRPPAAAPTPAGPPLRHPPGPRADTRRAAAAAKWAGAPTPAGRGSDARRPAVRLLAPAPARRALLTDPPAHRDAPSTASAVRWSVMRVST